MSDELQPSLPPPPQPPQYDGGKPKSHGVIFAIILTFSGLGAILGFGLCAKSGSSTSTTSFGADLFLLCLATFVITSIVAAITAIVRGVSK